MRNWVIAYDVPDDRRRTRLMHLLEGFGQRVQYSVFEAVLTEEDRACLEKRIGGVIDPGTDRVRLYPLCDACADKVADLGQTEAKAFSQPSVFVV